MSDKFFKCIAEQFKKSGRVYWACRSCNPYAENMNNKLKELEDKAEEAIKMGNKNKKEVQNLKAQLEQEKGKVDRKLKRVNRDWRKR